MAIQAIARSSSFRDAPSFSDALLPLAGLVQSRKPVVATARGPGFFARLVAAMVESRRAQVARELRRYASMSVADTAPKVEDLPF